jgi:hypothetical protein
MSESKIKDLIQEYLLEEGLIRKKIVDSKIEFGFQFVFPPGQESHIMAVFKPKEKDLIIISSGTQISEHHITALNALKDNRKMLFFIDLRKYFLLKNMFFRIDIQNYRYEISDQRFIERENPNISKNTFFKSIRNVFNCAVYSNILLGQYCSEEIKDEDFYKSKDFTGAGFSLYS